MVLGTALVLLAVEEGGGGEHGKAAREQHHGKPNRHVPTTADDAALDSLLGWRDGSVAIASGIAAALADIAYYQAHTPRTRTRTRTLIAS
jgi:hypothetical protein